MRGIGVFPLPREAGLSRLHRKWELSNGTSLDRLRRHVWENSYSVGMEMVSFLKKKKDAFQGEMSEGKNQGETGRSQEGDGMTMDEKRENHYF